MTRKLTSPDPAVDENAVSETVESAPAVFSSQAWAAGDGPKQVPLAGLLADDPSLADAELTHEQWEQRLADYLASERS